MKDLYVFTADTDATAVMTGILNRPDALGIRPIQFHVDRNVGRDSGMVSEGPELVRMKVSKTSFQKVLLIWDNHGSGWENKYKPEESRTRIQARLDGVTWQGHSGAVVIVPELEEWLWHDPDSICRCFNIEREQSDQLVELCAVRENEQSERLKALKPKELFEFTLQKARRRKPLPDDFLRIARYANLDLWRGSQSFLDLAGLLQRWFASDQR